MLELMRRKAQSPYLQATVLAIILVFVFWGVGTNNQNGGPNAVATVNDEPIPYQDYQKAYNQTITQYREQFGGSLPENILNSLGIKDQVLNQLIQRALILQEASKIGIHVSDREVSDYIQSIESFKQNGVFNLNTYEQILNASKITVSDFENGVRSDLLAQKVIDYLSKFGRVAPQELENRFAYDYEEIKLQYVVFDAEKYKKDVQIDDEALAAYFEENKDKYKTQPQAKVEYLTFMNDDIPADQVQPTEAEIEAYYQRNLDKYVLPERRRARHILIKTSESDSAEVRAEKREKIEEILQKARNGEDFAALAKKYSEDSTAARGGDLGFFTRGRMVKPFEDAAFALSEGDISDVIETQFGYHIIKVEEISPSSIQSLDEVRQQIASTLTAAKSKNYAANKANETYEKIILSGSLDKFAENSDTELKETGFFTRANPPEGIAGDPAFVNAVFSLNKGELSSLVELSKGYAIIYMADYKEPQIPPLADVKEEVSKDYVNARAVELAREAAEKALDELKGGADLKDIAASMDLKIKDSDYFSRIKKFSKDLPPAVIDNSLGLSENNPYPDEVVVDGDKTYLFEFKEKVEIAEDRFESEQDALRQRLMDENNAKLLESWVAGLREKAEITTNEQLL